MKCPACDGPVLERMKSCPTCGFPLHDLQEAVTRVRVVAFALAFIPLMYAVVLPVLPPAAHGDPFTVQGMQVLVWGMVAFVATVLLLASPPALGLQPEEAARMALRHGLLADLPAVFSLLLYSLGAPRADCQSLVLMSLLMFTFLVVRMPRLTAAMRWQMLVGFEGMKRA